MRINKDFVYKVAAISILIAAGCYFSIPEIAKWLMAVAVATLIVVTATTPYPGKSIRGKRLFNFQLFSCVLMAVASYLMFINNNVWALAMIAGAIFLLYAAIMIPRELEKEKNN